MSESLMESQITLGLSEWLALLEVARSPESPERVRGAAERAAASARTVTLKTWSIPAEGGNAAVPWSSGFSISGGSAGGCLCPVGQPHVCGLAPILAAGPMPPAPPERRLRAVE